MISRRQLADRVALVLGVGFLFAFVLSLLGGAGFVSGVYGASPHYPRWAYRFERTAYYLYLLGIASAATSLAVLPRRLRTLGILVANLLFVGSAKFLTEGEPPIIYKGPRYVITP